MLLAPTAPIKTPKDSDFEKTFDILNGGSLITRTRRTGRMTDRRLPAYRSSVVRRKYWNLSLGVAYL